MYNNTELTLLDLYLSKSTVYFEFFNDVPDNFVLYKGNIKKIYLASLNVDTKIIENNKIVHYNFNTVREYTSCANQIKDLDMILLNGDYKVACLLHLFNHPNEKLNIVLINYHKHKSIIEYYYDVINSYGNMFVLNKKRNVESPSEITIKIYEDKSFIE